MNATVVTADGRMARIVLFRTDVLSEQDYDCQPQNQLTLAEVQKLAKALGPPPVANSRAHPPRGDLAASSRA